MLSVQKNKYSTYNKNKNGKSLHTKNVSGLLHCKVIKLSAYTRHGIQRNKTMLTYCFALHERNTPTINKVGRHFLSLS